MNCRHPSRCIRNLGFTLVELLTVIAIIGILVGILIPVTQSVRASARRTSCLNNLRQVMLSILDHEIVNSRFPKADNGNGGSLFVELLPHFDQKFLYERSVAELANDETYRERMVELAGYPIDVLFCPSSTDSDRSTNLPNQGNYSTDYYGITGPVGSAQSSDGQNTYQYQVLDPVPVGGNVALGGMFAPDKLGRFKVGRGSKDALDGAANTLALGEISRFSLTSSGAPIPRGGWSVGADYHSSDTDDGSGSSGSLDRIYSAKSIDFGINTAEGIANDISFASSHTGGAQFAFVDASVRFVSETVDVNILKTFASTGGTEKPESLDVR